MLKCSLGVRDTLLITIQWLRLNQFQGDRVSDLLKMQFHLISNLKRDCKP